MTKQEKDELKQEIKKEVLSELRKELSTLPSKGKDFDFEAYKNEVVADDVKKAIDFINTRKWYWYIPAIGFIIYAYQANQFMTSIDRGILRKKINQASLPWLIIDVPFTYVIPVSFIFNYFPLRTRAVLRKAVELAKDNVE